MANIINSYTDTYANLRKRGITLIVAPDRYLKNPTVAIATAVYNLMMHKKPEAVTLTINEYDDGHVEYQIPNLPDFIVKDYNKLKNGQ